MNWYWIIAGFLMFIGGLAHTIIGEKKVITYLKKQKPETGFAPDVAFNLIRWFWYLGSYISFLVSILALTIGLTDDVVPAEAFVGKLLASIIFGFVFTFAIVGILNPKKLGELSQVVILALVTILLWVGAI